MLCVSFQNVPSDDQKIKSPVSGSLFAYELPASENYNNFDDERASLSSTRSQREGQTLAAIQRTLTTRSVLSGAYCCIIHFPPPPLPLHSLPILLR